MLFLLLIENIIGRGGYAYVYKGSLQDGQLIAVKQLSRGTPEDRISILLSELGILAHVDHPNTAMLIGFGVEGGMHLVFQLSPLGNLGSLLHGVYLILCIALLSYVKDFLFFYHIISVKYCSMKYICWRIWLAIFNEISQNNHFFFIQKSQIQDSASKSFLFECIY